MANNLVNLAKDYLKRAHYNSKRIGIYFNYHLSNNQHKFVFLKFMFGMGEGGIQVNSLSRLYNIS